MGKQQRAIPHGRYRLLDDKRTVRTEKLCAIYIEYSWNSTSTRRTTGYRCKVSDWNQKGDSGRGELFRECIIPLQTHSRSLGG